MTLRRKPTITLLILGILFFCLQAYAVEPLTLLPTPRHAGQCTQIVWVLERYHYLGRKLDNQLSSVILDHYIKQLDPAKQLFTKNEREQFSTYKYRFDSDLKKGDLTTAYGIYNLYLQRSIEHLDYVLSLLRTWETNIDLTKDEYMPADVDDIEPPENRNALKLRWKKRLKNDIISMFLEGQKRDEISERLKKIYSTRKKRILQTDSNDVFQIFMNSVTSSFDPHTEYFAPKKLEEFDIRMSLSLEGIGAVLQREYEYTKVVRLIPKGPADKGKELAPGDKIIGVGEGESGEIKDTVGLRLDHVVKKIRGPKNSYVRLKVIPAKQSDTTRIIKIKRDKVKLEEQAAQKKIITLPQGDKTYRIGIIEIPSFYMDFTAYNKGDPNYKSTTRDVRKLISELKKDGIDGLMIDLRDNGGGSLEEANQLTGLFIKNGPTVQIRYPKKLKSYEDGDDSIAYSGPLIVLINRTSASASEIFAGAIKDYNRGIIVGSTSFGKATVQEMLRLNSGRLKITRAKYYRVSGKSTQRIGITADIQYPHLYDMEITGESSLDGALPWDTIKPEKYHAYRSLDSVIARLNTLYTEREDQDSGLIYLKSRLKIAQEFRAQESISLNLEKRKKRKTEYEARKKKIEDQYLATIKDKDSKKDTADKNPENKNGEDDAAGIDHKQILTDETILVMADFIRTASQMGYTW